MQIRVAGFTFSPGQCNPFSMPPSPRGHCVESVAGGEAVRAFVPDPLPPLDLALTPDDYDLMERANRALGRLDAVSTLLPDPGLFLYFYVRREAVLSSQIEGTQSSLSDLLAFEAEQPDRVRHADVEEVSNYVAALTEGLTRLRGGFPLSLRLIRDIHRVLLRGGRGASQQPGEFRRSQVWIGGTRPGTAHFVPPPAGDALASALSDFEAFLHRPGTPSLLKAAIAHVQFETIHPFLDGNGRLGRLLVTFLLCADDVLEEPLLYLSLYFKEHRAEYYERLQRVRTHSDWAGWLRFFLEGVRATAGQAVRTARDIRDLFEADRRLIAGRWGARANSALRVHEVLQRWPRVTIAEAADRSGVSRPTAQSALEAMREAGITREVTGGRYGMVFEYGRYWDLLILGTEPLPP